jgi:hypothetical protein
VSADIATPAAPASVRNLGLLQAVAAFFLVIKIVYIFRAGPIFDEAYYWMWGQHPGLSYFDHPPLQAWLLGISDALFGRSLFALRWLTLVTLAGTFYIFHLWAKRMAGENWQSLFWPGIVIYLASPTFGYFTSLAFHDYLLIFLLLSSAHFFLNFLLDTDEGKQGKHLDLYLGAVLLGFAGLTKYNAVFLGLALFFYILTKPSLRTLLRDPHLYLAAIVAIGMQAPVVYWNLQDNFASYNFHLVDRHRDNWLGQFRWNTFIDFPLASAFLVSPFLVPVFWRFFVRKHETRFENVAKGFALWAFWLSSLTFVYVSMFDWVFWWWNLAAYVLVLPFAARVMGQKFLFWGHAVFGAVVALYLIISVTVLPLSFFHAKNPDWRQARLYGWEELRDSLNAWREKTNPDFIASDGPDMASWTGFAIDDPNVMAITDRKTQFYYWFDKEAYRGQNALIVLLSGESARFTQSQFETVTHLGSAAVARFGYKINGFEFYWAENYQPNDDVSVRGR